MLAIKLKRVGKKHQATFRVIVAEKRSKIDGRFVDDLGWLNPHTNSYSINNEAALKWIGNGAKPTDTVHNLLVRAKVIEGEKIPLHKKSKKKDVDIKAEVTNIKEVSVDKPEAEVKKGEEKPEEKGRVEKSEKNDMTQINNDGVSAEAEEKKVEAPVEPTVEEENDLEVEGEVEENPPEAEEEKEEEKKPE